MSENSIWFAFYIGDYLADTMGLSNEQHGIYLHLIMAYYKNQGPLPDDDKELAAFCNLTIRKWKSVRPKMEKFFIVEGGKWRHKRMDLEIIKTQENIKKAKQKSKEMNDARWAELRSSKESSKES